MTQEKLNNVFLVKPTLSEQKEIVVNLESVLIEVDSTINNVSSSIQKLKAYRQSIISEAVTGKVDLRDWKMPKAN
jgi:type I restriction enzyme S subunit